ncbi:somatostatin-1 [Brienomyrus brachyistius]|uniref:somatostatin-1 n=1 Tax=Brienomyrus brachyistius TaxID=42636 RepID=UPI0020B1E459|nr:somatostatin-1 [Brienomyrus brachyistius]XP_048885398.1 somatostatin-1 [Brienomyrus brachyistius]
MWRFQLQVLLVTLFTSILPVNGAPQRDALDDMPQAEVTGDSQDLSHMLLLDILSSVMTQVDNEVVPGMKELEFQRKAVRQLPLSQRERKAGCRNFFWKTYTSC